MAGCQIKTGTNSCQDQRGYMNRALKLNDKTCHRVAFPTFHFLSKLIFQSDGINRTLTDDGVSTELMTLPQKFGLYGNVSDQHEILIHSRESGNIITYGIFVYDIPHWAFGFLARILLVKKIIPEFHQI